MPEDLIRINRYVGRVEHIPATRDYRSKTLQIEFGVLSQSKEQEMQVVSNSECSMFYDIMSGQWIIIEDCDGVGCKCPVKEIDLNSEGIMVTTAVPSGSSSAAMIVNCVDSIRKDGELCFTSGSAVHADLSPNTPPWFDCFGEIQWTNKWLNRYPGNCTYMGRALLRKRRGVAEKPQYALAKDFKAMNDVADLPVFPTIDESEKDCTHMAVFGGMFRGQGEKKEIVCTEVVGLGKFVEFVAPFPDDSEDARAFWTNRPVLFSLVKSKESIVPIKGKRVVSYLVE